MRTGCWRKQRSWIGVWPGGRATLGSPGRCRLRFARSVERQPFISGPRVLAILCAAALLWGLAETARHTGVNGAAILLTLPAVVAVGVILLVGAAVVISVRRGRRSVERERAGLCVRCGYDVRQST